MARRNLANHGVYRLQATELPPGALFAALGDTPGRLEQSGRQKLVAEAGEQGLVFSYLGGLPGEIDGISASVVGLFTAERGNGSKVDAVLAKASALTSRLFHGEVKVVPIEQSN